MFIECSVEPVERATEPVNPQICDWFYLVLLNTSMKTTANDIRNFLHSQQQHITHWAVAHTDFHTYNSTFAEAERMAQLARAKCRFFRRCFSQFLYGAKAHRKPLQYQPLILTSIEGVHTSTQASHTIHFNFALGNIPTTINTEELFEVFVHCWVDKAQLSGKGLWLQQATPAHNTRWLNYSTKEAEKGYIDTWDFENTQIPYVALAAD